MRFKKDFLPKEGSDPSLKAFRKSRYFEDPNCPYAKLINFIGSFLGGCIVSLVVFYPFFLFVPYSPGPDVHLWFLGLGIIGILPFAFGIAGAIYGEKIFKVMNKVVALLGRHT